jgi:hypothetical protein
MNETPLPAPPARQDIDGLLRAYFQAEMPHPWPSLSLTRRQQSTSLLGRGWRIALAACVALLLLGYLSLAGLFPREGPSQAIEPTGRQIGDRPTHHPHHVAPSPRSAGEEELPTDPTLSVRDR